MKETFFIIISLIFLRIFVAIIKLDEKRKQKELEKEAFCRRHDWLVNSDGKLQCSKCGMIFSGE